MFKKTTLLTLLALSIYTPLSQASWKVVTEKDIFSNNLKAELTGDITNEKQSIIFGCSEGVLSFSHVEEDAATIVSTGERYQSIVKIAENPMVTFNAILSRRNPQSIQLISTESDKIIMVLKQIAQQNSTEDFLVGVMADNHQQLSSGSGSVFRSKSAVKAFAKACNIKL